MSEQQPPTGDTLEAVADRVRMLERAVFGSDHQAELDAQRALDEAQADAPA